MGVFSKNDEKKIRFIFTPITIKIYKYALKMNKTT